MRALAVTSVVLLGTVCCDSDPSGTDAGPEDLSADAAAPGAPDASGTSGCGNDVSTGATNGTIDINGLSRTYVLSVPSGYAPTTPTRLVFGWHGLGGTGALLRSYTGVEQQSAGAAIFVYPDARVLPDWGRTAWELGATSPDMAFFDALYERLTSELCIDEGRVFSYGHSFGGYMSNAMGCYRGDSMTAIAPVAGGGPSASCGGPVSAWISHSEDDGTVSFSQGVGTRDRWLSLNGCTTETEPMAPDPCVEYSDCDSGATVVWCATETGGHSWPGYAAEAIWARFASF